MVCEVKTFGVVQDFKKVQEYFGLAHDSNWLNGITNCISPTGDLIAMALGEKLALLSSCWNNKSEVMNYSLNWCGELENPNQIVTCLTCLPICGSGASAGPEWTCVVMGLSSGIVLFYTDTGIKIFSQSYYEEPVLSIKAVTPPCHSETDSLLYIVYGQCLCIVKGIDLLPLLRNLKKNSDRLLARHKLAESDGIEIADTTPYLKCQFARERETVINDAVIAGAQKPLTYNHIIETCQGYGCYAKVAQYPTQRSLIVGVGTEPYIGFYYAEEGYKNITLSEVAKDVLGLAYRNLMGNFFWYRRPVNDTPSPAELSDTSSSSPSSASSFAKESHMRARCRFYDGKRDGFAIVIAPGQRLAAITDNLDRVMLVDCEQGVTLRLWKGYRDAQCAFILVKERPLKAKQSIRRKALFLIIYAPHMGCLEIWALQNGPRVAAFNVGKSGLLVYNSHGLLGNYTDISKAKWAINTCLFLDPSNGSIKEITIPFHYALSEGNSKASRDIHQLRCLKNLLRSGEDSKNIDEITKLALEFHTIEVRHQCLEMLKKYKQLKPKVFQSVINSFLTTLDIVDNDKIEDVNSFKILLENYKRLTDFYIKISEPATAELNEELKLLDSDLVIINQLVSLLSNNDSSCEKKETTNNNGNKNGGATNRVTFQEPFKENEDFVDYLNIFQVEQSNMITLLHSKSEMFSHISNKIFGIYFERDLCMTQFKQTVEQAKIPCKDLLLLVLHFWINKSFNYTNCDDVILDMTRLAAVVRAICELAGEQVSDYAYNAISPWWQDVREILLQSPSSLGLLVAIVCKKVGSQLRHGFHEDSCYENSLNEDEDPWEQISQDEAQWGLLIDKLEDVCILGAILRTPIQSSDPTMPEIPYARPDCSLRAIVNGGKGIVTDLTAQWLINSRIHPNKLIDCNDTTKEAEINDVKSGNKLPTNDVEPQPTADENFETVTSHLPASSSINVDPVVEKLKLLRAHFPFSLESGMLLSSMSWHYMIYWSKNLQSLEYMRASLTCLKEFKFCDYALKHGICCILWNATLKYPLQSTIKLLQKVGHLPGEKLCQQVIEMRSSLLADFLDLVEEFLYHFTSSLNHEKRDLKFEETLAQGELPLQFIALQQHHAVKELLKLQTELCTVLHFIAFFQIKYIKPVTTLFDAMSYKAIFVDINKELSFALQEPDQVLQQKREDFLCKVITASMDLIVEDMEQLYVQEHEKYMKRIYNLAESWKLELKALKRQQIVEMYAHGYDAHGEALLQDILFDADEKIGKMLLEIAGRRLILFTESSPGLFLKVASVGPQLLQYLDNLKEPRTNSIQITATESNEIDIDMLVILARNAYKCLSRHESKELHINGQMFDACCIQAACGRMHDKNKT